MPISCLYFYRLHSMANVEVEVDTKLEDNQKGKRNKVKFIIETYPDLQPFLEMTVDVLEGLFEYSRATSVRKPVVRLVL